MAAVGADPNGIGHQVVVMGRTFVSLLLWIVLLNACRDLKLSVVRTFGVLFVLVDALSAFLGYLVVPLLMGRLGITAQGALPGLAAGVAFALVVASTLSLNRGLGKGGGTQPAVFADELAMGEGGARTLRAPSPSAAFDYAPYGLTERECAVARLLADGNSQKKIAETLQVSMGTVQTHIKGVYRKLGIHSRQELIDLVHKA